MTQTRLALQKSNLSMPKIWQACALVLLLLITSLLFIDNQSIKYGMDTLIALLTIIAITSVYFVIKRPLFPWLFLILAIVIVNSSFILNSLIFFGVNIKTHLPFYLEVTSTLFITLFSANLLYLFEKQYNLRGVTIDFSLIALSLICFVFLLSPDLLNKVIYEMNNVERSLVLNVILSSIFLFLVFTALILSKAIEVKDVLLGIIVFTLSAHFYTNSFISFGFIEENELLNKICWLFYQVSCVFSLLYVCMDRHEYNFNPEKVKAVGVKLMWVATIVGTLIVPFSVILRWAFGSPSFNTITVASLAGVMTTIVIFRVLILISNYEKQRQKLKSTTSTDALTGLSNYTGLHESVPKLKNMFLLIINIEDFKSINDMYDRKFGDEVLISLADRIKNAAGVLYSARSAGDNFIAVFQTEEENIQSTYDKFAEEIGLWDNVFNRKVAVPLTYGGSHSVKPEKLDVLIRNAEQALKQSRILKRHFTLFKQQEEDNTQSYKKELPRHELREILQHAIDKNELPIHFQPIYKARTGELKALEMLIRVNSVKHGLLMPGQFLEQAKSYGLLTELTHTCVDMISKQIYQLPDVTININLPPYMLDDSETLDNFISYFRSKGLSADRFCIEVTEDGDISTERLVPAIQLLKKEGFSVAMDDFGTGYSSLGRLSSLPFDTVKIDRSLLIAADNGDRTIIESAITLVKRLGVSVVVEGVETLEQLSLIRELGADSVQGYLFSKPVAVTSSKQFSLCASEIIDEF